MRTESAGYEIDDDLTRVDFARVHAWLASSYWTPGIARERVERGAANSALVVAAYKDGLQTGYARVISDKTRFAYLADVWVEEAHRGKGVARAMVAFALAHPEFQDVDRWMLATLDAHKVYEKLGFGPLQSVERWMQLLPGSETKRGFC